MVTNDQCIKTLIMTLQSPLSLGTRAKSEDKTDLQDQVEAKRARKEEEGKSAEKKKPGPKKKPKMGPKKRMAQIRAAEGRKVGTCINHNKSY